MIDKLKARIEEIENALRNAVTQHAQLLGHLEEARLFLKMAEEIGTDVANVADSAEKVLDSAAEASA